MSEPFGQPTQLSASSMPGHRAQTPSRREGKGRDLTKILSLVGTGLGLAVLVMWCFQVTMSGFVGVTLISAGVLAGIGVIPGTPRLLLPSTVLAIIGTLISLPLLVLGNSSVFSAPMLLPVAVLISGAIQAACLSYAYLLELGVFSTARQSEPEQLSAAQQSFPQQTWGQPAGSGWQHAQPQHPHSGQMPVQQRHPNPWGQPAPPTQAGQPGQFGQRAPGWNPNPRDQ